MKNERKFLHDLATPIGTVFFLVDSLLEDVNSNAQGDPTTAVQLQMALSSLEKVRNLMQERRRFLHQEETEQRSTQAVAAK